MKLCSQRDPREICNPNFRLDRPWRNDIFCQQLLQFQEMYDLSFNDLNEIKKILPIFYSWTKGYECARQSFNRRYNYFPLGIIFCENVKDIQNALDFIKHFKFCFAIRSSGHCYTNWSISSSGIVIDLSKMNKIIVQEPCEESRSLSSFIRADRFVEIEPGARLGMVQSTLSPYEILLPCGTCATVAINMVLGGGIGPYTIRKSGLLCDHLHAVEMILPSGKLIQATKKNKYSDLLWACQGGGGGQFGIITKYILHPCPFVGSFYARFTFPWKYMCYCLRKWQKTAPFCDSNMNSELNLKSPRFFPRDCVEIKFEYAGSNKDEFLFILYKSFKWMFHIKIIAHEIKFVSTVKELASIWASTQQSYFFIESVFWQGSISKRVARVYKYFIEQAPGPLDSAGFNSLLGQVGKIKPEETAFPWRSSHSWGTINGLTQNPETLYIHEKWVEKLYQSILKVGKKEVTIKNKNHPSPDLYFSPRAYVNVPQSRLTKKRRYLFAYYGVNVNKLRKIKTKYDPKNIFHFPQSIPVSLN